jgi:hypothetical protein
MSPEPPSHSLSLFSSLLDSGSTDNVTWPEANGLFGSRLRSAAGVGSRMQGERERVATK